MVEFERSKIPSVAANAAAPPELSNEPQLVDSGSLELPGVALMVIVRMSVFAAPGTEPSLTPAQATSTYRAN